GPGTSPDRLFPQYFNPGEEKTSLTISQQARTNFSPRNCRIGSCKDSNGGKENSSQIAEFVVH
ncbi:MAG: hypothetical protein ACYDIB_12945, partial [Desulfobulbia bacterium]